MSKRAEIVQIDGRNVLKTNGAILWYGDGWVSTEQPNALNMCSKRYYVFGTSTGFGLGGVLVLKELEEFGYMAAGKPSVWGFSSEGEAQKAAEGAVESAAEAEYASS